MPGPQEMVTMSTTEIDRLEVVQRVLEHRLTRVKAAELMGLKERQVRRLCAAYEAEGAGGLVSRRRGRPSNNRTDAGLQEQAMTLIRERYQRLWPDAGHREARGAAWAADFQGDGPSLDEG